MRHGASRARLTLAVALAVALAMVLDPLIGSPAVRAGDPPDVSLAIPSDDSLGADASLPVVDTPPDPATLPTLVDVSDGADAQSTQLPAADWDIDGLAAALEYDPQRAFAFVRDSIAFDPYEGELRGAEGTLAARAGNATDRAVLLAALLDKMVVPYRFAFADLDDQDTAAVLARALQPPVAPLPTPGLGVVTTLDQQGLADRARRDYARLRTSLGGALDTTVSAGPDDAATAVRHHVWVQLGLGPEWLDMDPTLPGAAAGTSLTPATTTAASIPDAAVHTVSVRLIAETLDAGALTETTVLDHQFAAPLASASKIFLYFQPAAGSIGGTITSVLSGDISWRPVLMVDGTTEDGSAFRTGGRGTDAFGTPTEAPDLTSLRLEIETAGPGVEPVTAERILLDRVPPELRGAQTIDPTQLLPMPGDDAGPFAMGQIHHIMVSTGGADLRDYTIQRAWSAYFAGVVADREDLQGSFSLADMLWPAAAADQALVVASERGAVPALEAAGRFRAYVAEPRVFVTTVGRDPKVADAISFETDLMIDGVALLPRGQVAPGDAAHERLWYGTLEAGLETQTALRHAALLDPTQRVIAAPSLAGPGALLRPEDASGLPSTTSVALRTALDSGSLVIVAGDPGSATAWWTVDPSTGQTRSIVDPGLGGAVRTGPLPRADGTDDSSYLGHSGPRLPPRPPMVRPPGGSTYTTPSTCSAGDSTGETALLGCISIPGAVKFFVLGLEVAFFVLLAYYAASQ